MTTPEHVRVNRDHWNEQADEWVAPGERRWASVEPVWGIWGIPESELGMLPPDLEGRDAIELGCGTGYVSAWMARRGARVVGVDISERQLATAQRLAAEHEVDIEWVHADAEDVPKPADSFDFAISEYGAALWCDPHAWIPEAHRLLRPGGELVFLSSSTLAALCSPVDGAVPITERLEREYFSIHMLDWRGVEDGGGIEFALPISGWFRLFRETGFEVVDFQEIQAPALGDEVNFFVTGDWARKYPSEQVWRVRKRL